MKGFAICLVVFGHCIQYGNGKGFDFFGDPVFTVIYSFHMPLFALVSGYLFFVSMNKRTPSQLFIKQIASFILPALSWSIVGACIKIFIGKFEHDDMQAIIFKTYYAFRFAYWFLWAAFVCTAGIFITERFFAGKLYVYAIEIFVLMFMPQRIFSSLWVFVYPYFIAGYIWHRDRLDEKFALLPKTKMIMLGVYVIFLWLILLNFFGHESYVYTTGTQIYSYRKFIPEQIFRNMFRWVTGFAGSASVMFLFKLIRPVKLLAFLGANSIGIYIISSHIMKYLPNLGGYIINFLEAVIITFSCCVLCWLIKQVRLMNKLLLGGR